MRFPHILLTTALVAFSGSAFAQSHWHGQGTSELLHGVALTDAQKDQVKSIEQNAWSTARPTMEQMHAVHEQIVAALLGSNPVSAADLAPLVSKEEALRNTLDQLKIDTGLQIRSVMTPSQLADAATKQQQLVSLHAQEHQILQGTTAQ